MEETPTEFSDMQLRRFFSVLFVLRARRHLKTLAGLYGWTPSQLTEYENQFICVSKMVPEWNHK